MDENFEEKNDKIIEVSFEIEEDLHKEREEEASFNEEKIKEKREKLENKFKSTGLFFPIFLRALFFVLSFFVAIWICCLVFAIIGYSVLCIICLLQNTSVNYKIYKLSVSLLTAFSMIIFFLLAVVSPSFALRAFIGSPLFKPTSNHFVRSFLNL